MAALEALNFVASDNTFTENLPRQVRIVEKIAPILESEVLEES